ncbi:MAG: hypothetical protein JWP97_2928 [Labilithrix sp.]|nr:hypothetical protein [Labilithrix sp.]
MGQVFAASDTTAPSPPVAIKVVSRLVFDETLMARLHREAEAAARIRSEYVPRVLEVSDTAEAEMYLVMERLFGEPLSQRMREKGPLPWPEVVQIGEDVLRGLIDAHIAGVVHRDLKPSNVFLAMKGGRSRAMVLDFGVCKLDTVDTQHLTGTGESIGTVAYMAPEQIRGASQVDDRADLYAFGVLVFELVAGRLPHDGPSQMAILASKLENEAARLRDCVRVPVPEGLDALVARALARDPAGRFTSAQELLKAWRKLAAADVSSVPAPATLGDADATIEVAVSTHSIHDAPTTIGSSQGSLPHDLRVLDVHATQTALTGGISLRRGSSSGRLGFVLAGLAVVAGIVVSLVAFFGLGRTPAEPVTPATVVAAASVDDDADREGGVRADDAPALGGEIDEAPAASAPLNGAAPTPPVTRRPHAKGHPATRSSGPHITSQPRY